jgi:hypothetical protein
MSGGGLSRCDGNDPDGKPFSSFEATGEGCPATLPDRDAQLNDQALRDLIGP